MLKEEREAQAARKAVKKADKAFTLACKALDKAEDKLSRVRRIEVLKGHKKKTITYKGVTIVGTPQVYYGVRDKPYVQYWYTASGYAASSSLTYLKQDILKSLNHRKTTCATCRNSWVERIKRQLNV